ncbi:MAG: hypothetical protein AB7O39_11725 [Flavobacteriaceae bacterium]
MPIDAPQEQDRLRLELEIESLLGFDQLCNPHADERDDDMKAAGRVWCKIGVGEPAA